MTSGSPRRRRTLEESWDIETEDGLLRVRVLRNALQGIEASAFGAMRACHDAISNGWFLTCEADAVPQLQRVKALMGTTAGAAAMRVVEGFVVHRFGDMARDAASAGGAFAVQMNLLFNAYAHDEHRADHAGRGGAAWDIPARWFGLLSSGEAHHARHHLHPTLACNSPHGAQEDWVFGAILLLERCGLVWEVRRRPKTE